MKKIVISIIIALIVTLPVFFASAEVYLRGDINMDGEITASDARSVLRVGAELDQIDALKTLIADVNEDGTVTASDARMILRVSAGLEDGLGSIDTGSTEKTELSTAISMNIEKFIKKYGEMSKVETDDGTTVYANDYVTVVSDPSMIYSGNINSISVTGGNYMLNGISAGSDSSSAVAELKSSRWIVKEETPSFVLLSKSGMLMKLTVDETKIIKVEYCVAVSLISPDETTTQAPETTTQAPETTTQVPETTTQAPETTTQVPETTTQAPETTTQPPETTTQAPETTTQAPETTTQAPADTSEFDKLPQQIKSFIKGEFALEGVMYGKEDETPIKIYSADKKVRIGSSMQTDTSTIYIDILAVEEKSETKMYILSDNTGKYCALDKALMDTMGLDASQMTINFGSADLSKLDVSERKQIENGQEYSVYYIKNPDSAYDVYMLGSEIKRIIGYDAAGNTIQMIGVNKFYTTVPAGKLSLDGYKKAWFGLLEVLGLSSMM